MASISVTQPQSFAIVANGDIKDYQIIKESLKKHSVVIAADGGANHCIKMNITPYLIVGDCDSISEENLICFKQRKVKIIPANKDKDETDLELAIGEAVKVGAKKIEVYGALGKRIDHTLYNLCLLIKLFPLEIKFITEKESIFSTNQEATLNNLTHKNSSFFSFEESSKIPLKTSNKEIPLGNNALCVETRVMDSGPSPDRGIQHTSHKVLDSYSVQSIFDLLNHLKKNPSKVFEAQNEKIFMIPEGKTTKYPTTVGQIISFLPLGQLEGLSTTGLKWPLFTQTFSTFFMSMSNESQKDQVEITLEKGHLLCCWNK